MSSALSRGKVCVVGSGLIGRNWAVLFARSDFKVTLYDISAEQLRAAEADIKKDKLPRMAKYSMLNGKTPEQVLENIVEYTDDLDKAVADSLWVQTGVPESVDIKRAVLKQIGEALLRQSSDRLPVISSSSSTIKPSVLSEGLPSAVSERLAVCHPVNPPCAIPVVECVPSPLTSAATMDEAMAVMKAIGMRPVRMQREVDGFVVNRLQYALLNAAYQLVRDGVATAGDVDAAVKHGLGLRWALIGPFETIHLNAPKGVADYCQRYAAKCIEPVMATIPHTTKWAPAVCATIHEQMCEASAEVTHIGDRCKWRDERLFQLAQLKSAMEAADERLEQKQEESTEDSKPKATE